jgi:hypothetical protein
MTLFSGHIHGGFRTATKKLYGTTELAWALRTEALISKGMRHSRYAVKEENDGSD